VSFDAWLLAAHVLSAFAYVSGVVLFWILIVAVRKIDTPEGTIRMEPVVTVGNAAVGVGAIGTIVLGIWLAFALDGYAIGTAGSSPRSCSGRSPGGSGSAPASPTCRG
jgi:hypothetical protein